VLRVPRRHRQRRQDAGQLAVLPVAHQRQAGHLPAETGGERAFGRGGRLWVTWFDGDGTPARLFVRASGTTGLSFGKTAQVALPAGTTTVWKAYTSAQAGKLDVVALLTRHGKSAYWATQVPLPR
jgi:hypothetical protein